VVDVKGDQVKLGISAPRAVPVFRLEVYQAIQEENRRAAASPPGGPPRLEGLEGDPTARRPRAR
jgi:carbon storage regulator